MYDVWTSGMSTKILYYLLWLRCNIENECTCSNCQVYLQQIRIVSWRKIHPKICTWYRRTFFIIWRMSEHMSEYGKNDNLNHWTWQNSFQHTNDILKSKFVVSVTHRSVYSCLYVFVSTWLKSHWVERLHWCGADYLKIRNFASEQWTVNIVADGVSHCFKTIFGIILLSRELEYRYMAYSM